MSPLQPDQRIAHYRIVRSLGAGGMGQVYLAEDVRLKRHVALKVLLETAEEDPERFRRFQREAETVASLNHPNIVTVHSIEEEGGLVFMTMEHVEGRSLNEMLSPNGLPVPHVLDISLPIAEALAAAHERGIVHRDLKPANVMLSRDGRVKVLDFGLAKMASGGAEAGLTASESPTLDSPLTARGMVPGTVDYMSPEQLQGGDLDGRSDLFSGGIILHELATGQRPFRGDTPIAVAASILRDRPADPASVRKDLPRELAAIILRCLEKEPARRYPTARELIADLRALRRRLRAAAVGSAPTPVMAAAATPAATGEPSLGAAAHSALAAVPENAPSIAVLPFANLSADPENEYFADGLSEELLTLLTKVRGLRVASRTSAFAFKGRAADLAEIAARLRVGAVLEGSVRKAGNRVRISVQLIEVSSDSHLWSGTYDRDLEDIFALQEEIAHGVVKELRHALLGESMGRGVPPLESREVRAAARARRSDAESYRLYLQGRYFVERSTPRDLDRAIDHFNEALERDPEYALAWAGLAQAFVRKAERGWLNPDDGFGRARRAAARALEIEPDLAEAHTALGRILMDHEWDWKGADACCRRALSLAPGDALVILFAGVLAGTLGRLEEAIALSRQATVLDPLSAQAHVNLGFHCYAADRLPEAEAAMRQAIALNPEAPLGHYNLGAIELARGRSVEALAAVERETDAAFRLLGRVLALHAMDRTRESDEALASLIAGREDDYATQIAQAHAFRGEVDPAFEWLERAYARRDAGLSEVKTHPLYRSLHGDPRWSRFLEKMVLAG